MPIAKKYNQITGKAASDKPPVSVDAQHRTEVMQYANLNIAIAQSTVDEYGAIVQAAEGKPGRPPMAPMHRVLRDAESVSDELVKVHAALVKKQERVDEIMARTFIVRAIEERNEAKNLVRIIEDNARRQGEMIAFAALATGEEDGLRNRAAGVIGWQERTETALPDELTVEQLIAIYQMAPDAVTVDAKKVHRALENNEAVEQKNGMWMIPGLRQTFRVVKRIVGTVSHKAIKAAIS